MSENVVTSEISLDQLLEKIPNKFNLVMVAAKRARQIKDGAPRLVPTHSVNPVTVALEEILGGKLVMDGEVARVLDEEGRPLTGPGAPHAEDLLDLGEEGDELDRLLALDRSSLDEEMDDDVAAAVTTSGDNDDEEPTDEEIAGEEIAGEEVAGEDITAEGIDDDEAAGDAAEE